MKTLFLILLIPVITFCQFQQDTMQITINIPAPQEVIDEIYELRTYIETRPVGQQMFLYSGMPIDEAEALGGVLVQSDSGIVTSFGYGLLANGYSYNVAIFGLDSLEQEVVHQIGYDRYFLRCGLAYGTLPLISDITDHQIYINVQVDFQ